MQARMKHPVFVIPDAMTSLQALAAAVKQAGVPERTLEPLNLGAGQAEGWRRAGQCPPRLAKRAGETDERLFAVAAGGGAPYFPDAERAALALTEALTRISDRPEPVSDATWIEAAR